MTELKPEHYITKEECQEMIDDAIRQHNCRRTFKTYWRHSSTTTMATNHIVDWIGIITAILFAVTMFIQGHFIFHGKHGYRHAEREQEKMSETRKQIEDLLKDK